MEALFKLIYSSSKKPNCTEAEIQKILASCEKNNPNRNITGILLHSDEKFIQYIEGSSKEVLALYDLIREDDRHKHVVMLSYMPINERVFPSWNMGYKNLDALEFNTRIDDEDRKVFSELIENKQMADDLGVSLLKRFFEQA